MNWYTLASPIIDSLCLVWYQTIRLFFRVDALERKKLNSLWPLWLFGVWPQILVRWVSVGLRVQWCSSRSSIFGDCQRYARAVLSSFARRLVDGWSYNDVITLIMILCAISSFNMIMVVEVTKGWYQLIDVSPKKVAWWDRTPYHNNHVTSRYTTKHRWKREILEHIYPIKYAPKAHRKAVIVDRYIQTLTLPTQETTAGSRCRLDVMSWDCEWLECWSRWNVFWVDELYM